MKVNLVKLNNRFYVTDNPNRLGNEVTLECSKENENDWCLEIAKTGNDDMILLIESKSVYKRSPGDILMIDEILDMKVINKIK